MKRTILTLIWCLGTMIIVNGQEKQAEQLLSEAIYQEEVNGELDEAIKTYQLIIKQYPENRKVAAEAYFHLGMCYEKMGNQEAKKAYQEILQKYGEQKELVAKAQERLLKLNPPDNKSIEAEGIKIRQIWKESYLGDLGTVSSDGRFRSGVDWEGWGDLAVHNLINGEMRTLTHEADSGRFVLNSAISKDGKQVAYCWWGPDHTYDLCLVDVDNPSPRTLYRQEGEEVYPITWLSDKELIVGRNIRKSGSTQICSVSILDGTIRVLKEYGTGWPQIAGSPDGKYIAYDFEDQANNGNRDINLYPMDGSDEISLVNHPANDRVLGWVPGRKEFLFISDRSGNWDLWAMPVDNGKRSGPVKRIYHDIGEVLPVGFTQNGDCFFGFYRRSFNTYLTPFNAEKGEPNEQSGKPLLGSNVW
ncbi:MAG: tetratricopeptide repeat protein, partial [Anaerolineales bacterium]|nr:tetratricopeptide repeat protein [Anaerolineales bacterium]